jgi:hypothetical protein
MNRFPTTGVEFDYVEENSDEDLQCCVCIGPAFRPVQHNDCGQLFCAACVRGLQSCPICRGSSFRVEDVVLKAVLNKLNALVVTCPDCGAARARANLEDHVRAECESDCSQGCGVSVVRAKMQDHIAQECAHTVVQCPALEALCRWSGQRAMLSEHKISCAHIKLEPTITHLLQAIGALQQSLRELELRVGAHEQTSASQFKETARSVDLQSQSVRVQDLQESLVAHKNAMASQFKETARNRDLHSQSGRVQELEQRLAALENATAAQFKEAARSSDKLSQSARVQQVELQELEDRVNALEKAAARDREQLSQLALVQGLERRLAAHENATASQFKNNARAIGEHSQSIRRLQHTMRMQQNNGGGGGGSSSSSSSSGAGKNWGRPWN